jgi:L-ascorbate metabolism protein UlaG (beta-lactamase superfamily)
MRNWEHYLFQRAETEKVIRFPTMLLFKRRRRCHYFDELLDSQFFSVEVILRSSIRSLSANKETAMKITWLGHSAFRIEACGNVILIDPFLTGNSMFTGDPMAASEGCTHIILTHGHSDHIGDTVDIAKRTGATLIAIFDLAMYLNQQGVANVDPGNLGGTIPGHGFDVTLVKAFHSASIMDDNGNVVYLGNPAGVILRAEGRTLYHMGDTEIFGDMELINEMYAPDIGCVPIGDRFTMGAKAAAMACKRFFNFKTVIPMHYGTFPIIDQNTDKFLAEMDGQNVVVAEVGKPFDV